MHSKHRLGNAITETGYYSYYQCLLPTIHKKVPSSIKSTQCALKCPPAYNLFECPLCGEPDSALYILSGCKHSTISNMVTERHKIASRILLKGVSKGPLGAALPPWTLAAQIALLYRTCRFLNTQQPFPNSFSLIVSLTDKGSLLVALMQEKKRLRKPGPIACIKGRSPN
eukprot:1157711-Pelagomonas_calceolata.AAC.28